MPGDCHPQIERALAGLGELRDPLAVGRALRRRLPAELAREAAELFELRQRAGSKFPNPAAGRFTRRGLEQATRPAVAASRARRIARRAPGALCYDATCGLGADAIAVAAAGLPVAAGDRDARTASCARANLAAAGHREWVFVADALAPPISAPILLLDPDRRAAGSRELDPRRWSPPLDACLALAARFEGACIKLAPSFDPRALHGLLPPDLPHRLQWISHARELCEVALWTGTLAGETALERDVHEVVALGSGDGAADGEISGRPLEVVSLAPAEVSEISWLCDPDPAVLRSGLLGRLARELGLAPVSPGIAWLGGRERPRSPLVRAWRIVDRSSADPKRVRAMLGRHDIGPVQVQKRGHPDAPAVLERRFRGRGSRRGLLAIARLERGHVAWLLEEPPAAAGEPVVGDEGIEPPTSSL